MKTESLEQRIIWITSEPLYGGGLVFTTSPVESFTERVWRHLRNGQMDSRTVMSGLRQLQKGLKALVVNNGSIGAPKIEKDYLGIPGLVLADYKFERKRFLGFFPKDENQYNDIAARLYEFPGNSEFCAFATSPKEQTSCSQDVFDQAEDAIAYFTGPTFSSAGLPNNGFYLRDYPKSIEFRDTNPSGQRRGAFVTSDSGELVVVDDTTKWALIRRGFPGIKSLIGGASFITDKDIMPELSDKEEELSWAYSSSYLFQYRKGADRLITGFALTECSASRLITRRILSDFVSRRGGNSFIVLEMEYNKSACFIKGQKSSDRFGGVGFSNRYDHYLVKLPKA